MQTSSSNKCLHSDGKKPPRVKLVLCGKGELALTSLSDIKEKVTIFKNEYRLDKLKLDISDWYSLFPATRDKDLEKKQKQWPGTYPQAERQGVYLIFNENKDLLYIGKASMNNNIGSRLGSYFSYKSDKVTCKVNHSWSSSPNYVVTIAVPDGMSFEAPALEEYLITEFSNSLPDNTIGTKNQLHNKSLNLTGAENAPPS